MFFSRLSIYSASAHSFYSSRIDSSFDPNGDTCWFHLFNIVPPSSSLSLSFFSRFSRKTNDQNKQKQICLNVPSSQTPRATCTTRVSRSVNPSTVWFSWKILITSLFFFPLHPDKNKQEKKKRQKNVVFVVACFWHSFKRLENLSTCFLAEMFLKGLV